MDLTIFTMGKRAHHTTTKRSQSTQDWLARQCQKQLPVNYYMATFTLPYELRALAQTHSRRVYALLFDCAVSTLKAFALNQQGLAAELGLCAVLHTHTRRLDYHPHVHILMPGGGVHRARREWRKLKGNYLFNGKALAKAFRGAMLHALAAEGLAQTHTPKNWVVQCQKVERGQQALQYLSRYLYRGVISNANILHDDGTHVTFRYRDSRSSQWQNRTERGEDFVHLLMQHVLPKGFRRTRDYGFLHGNAKALLRIVQWVLKVDHPPKPVKHKPALRCPHCAGPMVVIGIKLLKPKPG